MADYPLLAATIAAMNATKNDPQGTEAASKIDDCLRQTRNWLVDWGSTIVDPTTGKLRSSVFLAGSSLPAGLVRGSNPVGNVQREILQASILGIDIADGTITNAKMVDGTLTGAKMQDGSINGSKLAAGTITSTQIAPSVLSTNNIADQSVTGAKIALNTITGDRLVDGTVPNAKMGPRSVAGPNLPEGVAGQILVGGNGTLNKDFAVKTMGGAMQIDANGNVSLVAGLFGGLVTFARIAEEAANNTNGGNPGADGVWTRRGAGTPTIPWVLKAQTRDFLELAITGVGASGLGVITFKESGVYLIMASAPAYAVGEHKIRLRYTPAPGGTEIIHYGTTEFTSNDGDLAGNFIQTRSFVTAIIQVVVTSTIPSARPYMFIEHFTGNRGSGVTTAALGRATNAGTSVNEVFADMTILRIQDTPAGNSASTA